MRQMRRDAREGFDLKAWSSRRCNHKVTCAHCGRRRYGASYILERKQKHKHKT